MKKIRVLQIIKGLDIGGDSGGAELFGIKLARYLNKNNFIEVHICAFYKVGTETEDIWIKDLNEEGIKTFFVSEWGGYTNFRKFFKGIINLFKIYNETKFDVVHSHFQLGSSAAIISKIFGKSKTAYRTSHIREEWNKGPWTIILNSIFIRGLFPLLLDGEIGVSQAVCDYLLNRKSIFIKQDKHYLIYNGIDVQYIIDQSCSSTKEDITNSENYNIVCVGRLSEQKGYPYLINAIEELSIDYPDIKVYIIGDGELRFELLEIVNHSLAKKNIKFLGLRNDVFSLLKQFDLFILPSLWEGLPTVILEAMALHVPVIATNIPGTRELVIDEVTGLLVQPRDSNSLAQKILKLYKNRKLAEKYTINAFDELSRFEMKNIADQYIDLYKKNL